MTVSKQKSLLHLIKNTSKNIKVPQQKVKHSKISALLEKYTELYDFSPTGYFTLDQEGFICELNLSGALLIGKERSALVGERFAEFIKGESGVAFSTFFKMLFETNVKTSCEVLLKNDFNPFMYVYIDGIVVNQGTKCLLVVVDITERRKAEAALKSRDKIFNLSLDMHCITGFDGYFKVLNPSWTRVLGWSNEELLSKPATAFLHPDDLEETLQIRSAIITNQGVSRFENRFLCKNGIYKHLEWNSFLNASENTIISIARDITQKKEAEEENRKLAMIASLTINAVILTDAEGYIQWVNKGFERITQYSFEEVIGKKPGDFLQGEETDPEVVQLMRNSIKNKEGFKVEIVNYSKAGDKYWLDIEAVPMLDKQNKLTGFMAIERDITDRKLAGEELLVLNEDLNKRARALVVSNNELERFAYVASHDLQEPLRMVNGFMRLLIKNFENVLDEKATQYVRYALDGSERMKDLIKDLLEYSKVGTNKEVFTETNLNSVLLEVTTIFQKHVHKNQPEIHYPLLPVIYANSTQMLQLMQNLVGNAIKYKSSVKPIITISFTEEADNYLFSVADNGIGIDPQHFDKIFNLFQRLHIKEEYSGTGIGLAICKKIVEKHGGKIWVSSLPGQGSTFYFTIKKQLA